MQPRKPEVTIFADASHDVAALKLSLVTRHVRGHRPGPGRQWVNGEVDRIARTAMRDRRQQLAEGGTPFSSYVI
jgi:hypothetical protein